MKLGTEYSYCLFNQTFRFQFQSNMDTFQLRQNLLIFNHNALTLEARKLGKRLPDSELPAAGRLAEINIPVLVIVGEHDTPYILAAADVMEKQIHTAQKATIADAAHLPNMEHPKEFRDIISSFLNDLAQ